MPAYSNLFSSGLLAPSQSLSSLSFGGTQPPSSPIIPQSPADPIDRDLSLTPTQHCSSNAMLISPGPGPSSSFTNMTMTASSDTQRPRLRKRRSSISITTSPMASLKSPTRSAGCALQRTGILSSSRNRSESLGVASADTSLAGRMRSVTGIMKSRRVLRKASGPAPTVPLPDVPAPPQNAFQFPLSQSSSSLPPPPPPVLTAPNPRRPLCHRLHTLNLHALGSGPNSFAVSGPDFTNKLVQAMSTPPASPATSMRSPMDLGTPFQFQLAGDEYRIDEAMKEN